MIGRLVKRVLQLLRRIIGIPQLEARIRLQLVQLEELVIRKSRSSAAAIQASAAPIQAYIKDIEDRNRTLAALGMPLISSSAVTQKDLLHFCGLLAPLEVQGFKKIRMGNDNDGGYVLIDDFADVSLVISCGVGPDVTFDLAFAERGKPVMQFDHTVEATPASHPKFTFRKQAIDALGRIPNSVKLWDIVDQEGAPPKKDLLLKIDIDGDEWATFANFPPEQLKRFRQIVCEFHWSSRLKHPEFFSLCLRAIENIRKEFFPAHLHANNFVDFSDLMGVPIPEVYEVTFVSREIYCASEKPQGTFTKFDNPNNPDKPDLFLGSPFRIG